MQPTPAPSSPPQSQHELEDDSQLAMAAEGHPVEYPSPPQNTGSAPFQVLTALFEKLQAERKVERRRRLLASWFNHWREEKGYDLYPVLRLILPQKDRERAVYGLKEKNLAKAYIKAIPLGLKDPDAVRLLNWKRPSGKDKSSGDFPLVLYEVINKRSSIIEGSMTIDEVNDILDEIAQNMGKSEIQFKLLRRLYNQTTPEEQRWIARIILKDMQISVKETSVFSAFHPDAHDLYNTCSDLKRVAWELWDPKHRLNEKDKGVQLFRAFAPMLCKRPTRKIEDSVKEMKGRAFIIEEKLDGERMQVHKRGNEYFYCSRKGKDYTHLYGRHIGTGSLTPFIDKAFDSRVDEIILDGEMLVWDPASERHLPFGSLKTAALDTSKVNTNPRPCFKVFDLLYLNGVSIINKSLKFRKRNLRACLKEVPGRLELAAEHEGRTAKDVRTHMDAILASRGEGLVLKYPDSEYVLNGRNKDWIKVKPEYMDNMGETVDVLVVGGCYGSGRRSGGVSTFICAVLDDRRGGESDELKYSTFLRFGTGFSYADYLLIRQKPWKEWDPKNPPSFVRTSRKASDDKGDLYLDPEDSFIVSIKAAEIVPSDQYHIGFTMRFPRATRIRDDLNFSNCLTATALLENVRSGKKRKMEEEENEPKKKPKKVAKQPSMMPEYKAVDLQDVEVTSELFKGMKFMVSSDPKSRTGEQDKKNLLKMIRANGGSYVQVVNKNAAVMVIYGGKTTPYDIKLVMNKDTCDIVKPQWIRDCVEKGELVPLSKKYFFYATSARRESEDYRNSEDDGEEAVPSSSTTSAFGKSNSSSQAEDSDEDKSGLAEWIKIDKDVKDDEATKDEAESETEPDSDNEDVNEPDFDTDDDSDDQAEAASASATDDARPSSKDTVIETKDEGPEVKMGEDDTAMHYDQDYIFKHLCFYLDSPANARKHGMDVKSRHEQDITRSFDELSTLITKNGGRVVDLDEPKLTHVVIDKRDASRRLELIKRTSKPKHRHMVISEFIQACLDEDTLLDEDEFAP